MLAPVYSSREATRIAAASTISTAPPVSSQRVVDSRPLLSATKQVFLSQSAVSVQLKKLEDLVHQSLFQGTGRRLLLTARGHTDTLAEARAAARIDGSPLQVSRGRVSALEKAGRRQRVVIEAPNLSTLNAAMQGGCGVTCRMQPSGERAFVLDLRTMPPLPPIGFVSTLAPEPIRAVRHCHQAACNALAALGSV